MSETETETVDVPVRDSRPVRWIAIEPGAHSKLCKFGCGTLIYFSEKHKRTGNRMPVDLVHVSAIAPTATTFGQGEPHFAHCPKAPPRRTA